jgi:excisionase family DNA binding protein
MMVKNAAHKEGRGGSGLPNAADLENRLCIKVTEAAKMLGISRNFAYELIRQGKLPYVKLGKRLLIPKAALEKMLVQGVNHEGTH